MVDITVPSVFTILHDTDIKNYCSNDLSILNQTKNEYDLLEIFVYNSVLFHLNRFAMNSIENYTIEFWTKSSIKNKGEYYNSINNFHVDCDEVKRQKYNTIVNPCFSIVTYFSENNMPLLLTDITFDDYKFKLFENKNKITILFPEENKQIVFDGKYMHGVCNIFDEVVENLPRHIIAINVWDSRLLEETYYFANSSSPTYPKSVSDSIFKIIGVDNPITEIRCDRKFDFELYNNMLYNTNDFKVPEFIKEPIRGILNTSFEYKKNYCLYSCQDASCNEVANVYTNTLLDQVYEVLNRNMKYSNRFLQRFKLPKFYDKVLCEWIITEADKVGNIKGWTTTRHEKYPTTDLPVESIPQIFSYIIHTFKTIFKQIDELYCLDKKVDFNIKDLFIVKYEENAQTELEEHDDGSFFTVNLLLSDPADFVGGGTYFEDGIQYNLNQGDCILHCGRIKHQGIRITKGKRYLLVAFIGIIITKE